MSTRGETAVRGVVVVAEADTAKRLTDAVGPTAETVVTTGDAPTAVAAVSEDDETDVGVDAVVVHHNPPAVDAVAVLGQLRAAVPDLPAVVVGDDATAGADAVFDADVGAVFDADAGAVFDADTTAVATLDDGDDVRRSLLAVADETPARQTDDDRDGWSNHTPDGRSNHIPSDPSSYTPGGQSSYTPDDQSGNAADDLFRQLHQITADPEPSFEEQIDSLLQFGTDVFGTELGFLVQIDEERGVHEVVASTDEDGSLTAGATHDLGETYCRRAVAPDTPTPMAVADTRTAFPDDDPATRRFDLGCYLGGEVVVDGERYGTLCFADDDPRERPFDETERELAATMVRWVGQWLAHRAQQRDLAATRDRLQRIFERVTDAFFAVDREWRITYVNEAGAAVLRGAMGTDYSESELLGRHLWEEIPEAVDTTFYEKYHRAVETGEPVTFEEHYAPLDVWFDVRAFPDEDGLSVYFTDVTERKRREQALDGLLAASQEFMLADTEQALADQVLAAAADAFGYALGSVRLHDAEAGTLPAASVTSAAAERVPDPPTYDDDEGLAGEAFQTGEPVIVDDLGSATDYEYDPIQSAVFLPLGDHGTLALGAEETAAFDGQDAALAELLAVTAASAFDRLDREAELRDLQRTVAHVDQMVFLLDGDGRFRLATDRLVEALGREQAWIETARLADIVVPEDADQCADHVASLRDADPGARVTFETAFVSVDDGGADAETTDGDTTRRTEIPVEVELSAVATPDDTTRVAGAATDISELTATRTSLETARDRFRRLFESLPDPVVEVEYVDDEPTVRYVNSAFSEVFGFETDTVLGENLNEFVADDYEIGTDSEEAALDSRIADGEQVRTEVKRATATGPRDFLLQAVPHSRGEETYAFAVYTEITEQKQREQYLQILNRVLRHNLRNDMNVVTMIAEELAAEVADDRLAGYAEQLAEKARDVATLSEKAKGIERVTGRQGEETRPVDVAQAAREVVERYSTHTTADDATLTVDLPPELWADATPDVRRAVAELVENALQHGGPEPTVTVAGTLVEGEPRPVRVSVTDDGPGLPEEEWAVVAGERDITQLDHGSGLGLWLVKRIVTACGGEILRHETDTGETVEIRLPSSTDEKKE